MKSKKLQQPVQTELKQPDLFRNTIRHGDTALIEWRQYDARSPGGMYFI
jgi:hypothetical protein